MGLKLTHAPSGTTVEIGKEPDLPLSITRNPDQDVVITDGGQRKVFTRRVPIKLVNFELKLLNHRERKLIEQFFEETVDGQMETFEMDIQIDHQEPLQVGSTQDGNPITVGTELTEDCGEPAGPIQVGQWVRVDRYLFSNCRFNQQSLIFSDELPFNFNTRLSIVQERV